ncbi:DUF1552 domain-containing protein [bacterium]|nr:DUF1552 domain-containing protein [bacterium]
MSVSDQNRRKFLRTSGLTLALPMLESLAPAIAAVDSEASVKRLVCAGVYLGFHTPSLFPEKPGPDYQLTDVLSPLEQHRKDLSLFSGLDHRAANGHNNWSNYLKGTGSAKISMDQMVAAHVGDATRYASLQLTCGTASGNGNMSYTKEGIGLPAIGRPSVLFGKLFSSAADKARTEYILDSGRSVLDLALQEARDLQRRVSGQDRKKLDEYFSSVRDVEKKVQKQRAWLDKPSPTSDYKLPEFDPISADLSLECETIMYDLMALALETDSTRTISFLAPGAGQVFTFEGEKLSAGYHGLSHHGNDLDKIADFNRIGREHVACFSRFLDQLKAKKDAQGRPLIDSTAVIYGSGMGNANTHDNSNLPVLLAGGGFRHGHYHAIDRASETNATPLFGDLFITVMQRMGMGVKEFVKAKRNLNELLT